MREREMFELHQARKDRQNIAQFAPALEPAVGGFRDLRWKPKGEQVVEVEFALCVAEANYVTRAAGTLPEGCNRVFDPARREIFQKRISSSQGQESQSGAAMIDCFREKTIDYFEGRTVAADDKEVAHAFAVGLARDLGSVAGATGLRYRQLDSQTAYAIQRARG
jgi:hypothetical protein